MPFSMKAIVCLTRGYRDVNKYETLLKRNDAIYRFFGDKYPILIFHEGNISGRQQRYIKSKHPMDIQFHDIGNRWTGGYEGMCRFHAYDIWEVCQHYEYILRIDEDCHLLEMTQDPFENIGDNVYLKSVFWAESHSETNATLPDALEKLTGSKRENFYNGKFVYTNVSLSNVSIWREGKAAEVLGILARSEMQRINRWGDLPLLGSLLNIYFSDKVGTLTGMKYSHLSHGNIITCG